MAKTSNTFEALKADSSIYEHVFSIWGDRLKASKIFDNDDEDDWNIDFENGQKVLNAI